ncbi:ribonucleases P/MRP protein subunit POP1-like [Argonauta hians]
MSKKTDRKRKFSEVEPGDQSKTDLSALNVVWLVESRAQEITSLNHHVQTKTVNKMVLETLPKHMNRRAMAHDIRRWPRRLRHLVKKQYENQGTKRLRRPPSRKHRRRPSNLLAEYNRRKKKHVWLETHIWHAKRFLMTKKWGYHLAKRPTCKTNRRTYNSVMKYCLLQDVSFLCCIEITGPESEIVAGFSHLSSPATGPGVGARCYLNGCREGSTVLYKHNQYPHDAIGFVTFLWKPICSVHSSLTEESSSSSSSNTESEDIRYLWLWCHPSCYNQLWEELVKVFQNVIPAASEHKSSKDVTTEASQEASDIKTSSEAKPNQTSQSSTSSTASQSHSSGAADKKSGVFLKSLKDQLVRFRLTGPLTLKVLSKAINVSEIKIPSSDTTDTSWWHTYFNSEDRLMLHQTKVDLWRSLGTAYVPAELPKHWILGMTVMDPRLRLPSKKQRAVPSLEVHGDDQSIEITPELSMSPLWQQSIRTEVKTTKLSEHQFNKMISENTLPGDHQHVQGTSSLIPLLLIQRPVIQSTLQSCNSLNPLAGTGCDIILPVGWGMVFWISLVYQGAQVGGLNEACQTSLEIGDLHFPFDFPDTEAGLKEISVIQTKKLEAYLRRPPSKRPNFERLGVPIPFHTDYLSLVQDLNKNSDIQSFCVLRDRKKLIALSRSISSAKDTKLKISSLFVGDTFYKQTIVPVIIEMISKGVPGHNSMICVPRKEDLVNLKSKKSKSFEEPLHKNKRTKTEKDDNKKIKTSRLCEAKLKDGTGQLLELSKTSRKIIGFLTKGKYSFLKSSGVGIGFCSIVGLEDLLANSKNIVLVRNIQSLEYRYAKLSILS